MIGLGSKHAAVLLVGVLVAVATPLVFVLTAVNDAPPPSVAIRQIASLKALTTGTASVLVKAVPPPPPPPPPLPPPPVARAPVAVGAPVPANPTGAEAVALEQRLADMGYLIGKVDGVLDGATRHGIIAFQKVEGLKRSGVADPDTLARLATAQKPGPKFTTPGDHFEVDIPRQVVFMVRGGQVAAIVPTSTGNNKLFTSQGYTRRAVTPNGEFQINYKRNGWRTAPLGRLYRPAYFNGGIALHGSTSVPTGPASHGCVRLPMVFADYLLDNAPIGMVVYVYGGPHGENPQPVLDEDPIPGAPAAPVHAAAPAPVPEPPAAPVAPPPPAAPPPGGLLDNLLRPA